ncbi:MAG TPA: SDR family oxidoreductase, partial [Leptospiraceae bacterium]|nr:SDR family oxidoreductase [Leptospiraceae bacterium]
KYQESNKTLDALFLCQGDGLFGEIEKIDRLSLEKHFQLNLFSQFSILQFAYPLLRISDHPFVCFLSSTAGKVGFPESTAYCASKHAVAGLAKSLREEWKKDNIRVMTVYPGAISTSIWEGREGFDQNDMIAPEDFAEYLASFITLPKTINLDESYVLPQKGIL